MIVALVWKELREIRGITLIGLAVFVLLVGGYTGTVALDIPYFPHTRYEMAFADGSFVFRFGIVTFPFAMAIGFRQSTWESITGACLFLLHRPVARRLIFVVKLATGVSVLLTCSLLPIVVVGAWYARPGNLPAPFEWSMTDTTMRLWLSLPAVYLGAFLSGLRPGNWLGTRLLPLFGTLFAVMFLQGVPSWWLFGLALMIALSAILTTNICAVAADREYP
jgi:hypothetical protein